jgi:hypothetical protein
MSTASENHQRFDPYLCCVCRRPASGVGYAPKYSRSVEQIAWTCLDPECLEIAAMTYSMSQTEFGRLDELATQAGGAEAGQYLDQIGKTDLATLDEREWQTFLRRLVSGYRVALKTKLRDESPF